MPTKTLKNPNWKYVFQANGKLKRKRPEPDDKLRAITMNRVPKKHKPIIQQWYHTTSKKQTKKTSKKKTKTKKTKTTYNLAHDKFPLQIKITKTPCRTTIKLSAGPGYEQTKFIKAAWPTDNTEYEKYNPKDIVVLRSTTNRNGSMKIDWFYGKHATVLYQKLTKGEKTRLKGLGGLVLCLAVSHLKPNTQVKLTASGGYAWSKIKFKHAVSKISDDELIASLKKHLKWYKKNNFNENREDMEEAWVGYKSNQEIVKYYSKFGFQLKKWTDYWYANMTSTAKTIKEKCQKGNVPMLREI
jgi:hypothetical protein